MKDKSSELLTILIYILFAVVSVFLVVFFIKRNVNSNKNYSSPNYSENIHLTTSATTTIDLSNYTTTKSNMNNEDRTYYNQLFKSYVKPLLSSLMVTKDEPNLLANINYNNNMLNDNNFAYSFVIYLLLNDSNIPYTSGDGMLSINLDTFNDYYYKVLGKTFDINELSEFDEYKYPTSTPRIDNKNLYASYSNNYKAETYMDIKAVNLNSVDNTVTITSDVVVYSNMDDYNKYSDTSNYEYPKELIYTKLDLTFSDNKLIKIVFRN